MVDASCIDLATCVFRFLSRLRFDFSCFRAFVLSSKIDILESEF